jgi:hypothetical protein
MLIVNACASTPAENSPNSFFRATISGAVVTSYSAGSYFTIGDSVDGGQRRAFYVNSLSQEGGAPQGFILHSLGGLPAAGRYALATDNRQSAAAFTMIYFRSVDAYEAFVSLDGELVITQSSANHVAGSFRTRVARYCRRGGQVVDGSCTPSSVSQDALQLTLQGEFSAKPGQGANVTDGIRGFGLQRH